MVPCLPEGTAKGQGGKLQLDLTRDTLAYMLRPELSAVCVLFPEAELTS